MNDDRHFVVIGASQAGCWIAKTLRKEGFLGRITLIGEEAYYPYERPPLSKDVLLGSASIESTYFWPPESYKEDRIDVRLNTTAIKIQKEEKTVTLQSGEMIHWDKLAITTGSRVRQLDNVSPNLRGVHYLRSLDDTEAIRRAAQKGGNAVIIGGGWIGLECASTLKKLGCHPIVVEASERLCMRAVTPEISEWMQRYQESNGVDVRLSTRVEKFNGSGSVSSVCLSDGSELDCSIVIVGVGVLPNIELAKEAGLLVDNGIVVDDRCATSDPDVFSAGDVTNHPNSLLGRRIRLESWDNAMKQGINAGMSMLGKGEPYSEVPWFWSNQFEANIQIIGVPEEWDQSVVRGNKKANEFVEFYLKDNFIVGAIAVNSNRDLRIAKRLMQMGKEVSSKDLADVGIKMQTLV